MQQPHTPARTGMRLSRPRLVDWDAGGWDNAWSPLTFALSSSTMKWHRAALKKYSLALYLSKGLSIVLVPTWHRERWGRKPHHEGQNEEQEGWL